MAVVLRFTTKGFTAEKYASTVERLEAAGADAPTGRLYHVCFGEPGNLRVSDIWDSKESFERFSETLFPIMKDLQIPEGELEFFDVHNIIVGENTQAATP